MKKNLMVLSRRGFMKAAGLACGYAILGVRMAKESAAAVLTMVGLRQDSVYRADADRKKYPLRKSQENPMIKSLYARDGFLHEGPGGHRSHELLHTHYVDRSAALARLRAKGVDLAL